MNNERNGRLGLDDLLENDLTAMNISMRCQRTSSSV